MSLIRRIEGLIPYIIKVLVGHVEVVTCLLELSVIPSSERLRSPILTLLIYDLFLHYTPLCTLFLITPLSPITLFVWRWTLVCIVTHYSF